MKPVKKTKLGDLWVNKEPLDERYKYEANSRVHRNSQRC